MRLSVIGLKRKLVDEHAILVRELKKSLMNEMELEETKNQRYELSCFAIGRF